MHNPTNLIIPINIPWQTAISNSESEQNTSVYYLPCHYSCHLYTTSPQLL